MGGTRGIVPNVREGVTKGKWDIHCKQAREEEVQRAVKSHQLRSGSVGSSSSSRARTPAAKEVLLYRTQSATGKRPDRATCRAERRSA